MKIKPWKEKEEVHNKHLVGTGVADVFSLLFFRTGEEMSLLSIISLKLSRQKISTSL